MNERIIFDRALDLDDPQERAAYLDEACGSDVDLRSRVAALLRSHEQAGAFLCGAAANVTLDLDQPISEKPGAVIGPYKLLQQIGEGGMGVVYMAEQAEPVERRVALKIIKPGMDTRQVIARFEAERQALAMMDHPNIAKVLDAGTTESGRPYFVMELVRGLPITEYCDQQHLTPKERLHLFIPVCQAVQHAHQKGLIHRDLKPSNVMIALYDDRPVPKVIDFGVAKATGAKLTEKTMFTQYGQIVGTLEYMSPEQANLNQLDVDTRSDIYSLGVLLYELLAGVTPFDRRRLQSAAFDEMMRIIREEEPPKPSRRLSTIDTLPSVAANRKTEPKKLSALVRGELDWIVMKALDKDRTRRYETANGLANDVQRYLHNEAVVACPPSAAYRFRKFARRNKVALLTGALMASALLMGITISTWQAIRATTAENAALASLVSEQQAHREAELARQKEAEQRQAALQAQSLAEKAREQAEAEGQRAETERQRAEASFFQAKERGEESLRRLVRLYVRRGTELVDSGNPATALAWYVKALRLDSGNPNRERAHRVRFAETLKRCARLLHVYTDVERGEFSPDSRTVLLNTRDGIQVRPVRQGPHQDFAGYFATFSPDGKSIAVLRQPKHALLVDAETGETLADWGRQQLRPVLVQFSGDGRRAAMQFETNSVQVLETPTGDVVSPPLASSSQRTMLLHVNQDGSRVITIGRGAGKAIREVDVWDTGDASKYGHVAIPARQRHEYAAVSPDGLRLAVGGQQCFATIYDSRTGRELTEPLRVADRLTDVRFDPAGTKLIVTSADNTARIWDAESGVSLISPIQHVGQVLQGRFSRDSRHVVTITSEGVARVWDAATGQPVSCELRHQQLLREAVLSPDGRYVLTIDRDGQARIWDLAGGMSAPDFVRGLFDQRRHGDDLGIVFHPDGRRLATFGHVGVIWDMISGKVTTPSLPVCSISRAIAFSPDGTCLLTLDGESFGRVFDADTGVKVQSLPRLKVRPTSTNTWQTRCQFTRQGDRCLVMWGSARGSAALVWDLQTQRVVSEPWEYDTRIPDAALSPDGCLCAIGVDEPRRQRVDVFDVESGELKRTISLTSCPRTVDFSPDSRQVVVGCDPYFGQGTAKIWNVESGQVIGAPLAHRGGITEATFSPDGGRVVTSSRDGAARVWQARSGKSMTPEMRSNRRIDAIAFSPDGFWVATGTRTNNLAGYREEFARLWDAESGEPVSPLYLHEGNVQALSFSPDGKKLATVSKDACVRVWGISVDRRPIDVLSRLAVVYSGMEIDDRDTLVPIKDVVFREAWKHLQDAAPDEFLPLPAEDNAWHRRRADMAAADEDWDVLSEHLTAVIALDPHDPDLYRRRMIAYWQLGQFQQALNDGQKFVDLVGPSPQVLVDIAKRLSAVRPLNSAAIGRLTAWGQQVLKLADRDPDDLAICKGMGQLYFALGDHSAAMPYLSQGIRLNPDDATLWNARGMAYARLGQLQQSLLDHAKAAELDATNSVLVSNLAWINLMLDRPSKAAEIATKALDLDPRMATALKTRAGAHMRLANWEAAISDYSQLMVWEPDSPVHLVKRGQALLAAGDQAGAEADFEAYLQPLDQAVTEKPEDWQTWNRRGVARLNLQHWEAALADLEKAVELAPQQRVIHQNRAATFVQQDRWKDAADALAKVVQLGANEWRGVYELALCSLGAGNTDRYRQVCRRMLENGDTSANAFQASFTAWTCALAPGAVDDYQPLVAMASRAVEQAPDNDQFASSLGAVFYRAGRYDEALHRFTQLDRRQRASTKANFSPAYTWYFLAMTQHALGRTNEAQAVLARANEWKDKVLSDEKQPPAWNRRLTLELLQREANQVVSTKPDNDSSQAGADEPAPASPMSEATHSTVP